MKDLIELLNDLKYIEGLSKALDAIEKPQSKVKFEAHMLQLVDRRS